MRRLVPALLLSLPLSLPLAATDWTRFRGPNGSGVAEAAIPTTWSKTENVLWAAPVPGGHSSPIVVKGRVFLQSASPDGRERTLHAFDANTGKPVWAKTLPAHKVPTHAKSSLASSTPASDGERVFFIVWDGDKLTVRAYDLDGKDLWSAPLGGFVSQHGAGLSPVAFGGKVFINYDQDKEDPKTKAETPTPAKVVALDAATGSIAWTADRKPFRACYSSPLVRELPGGKSEVLVASTAGLTGYNPDDGHVNWNWDWHFSGPQALRTVGSPILAGGVIVAISGDGNGSREAVAVEPGTSAKRLWVKVKESPYVPGPLVLGEHLYWLTDDGQAMCFELKTGKLVWKERVLNRAISSSPVLVAGNVVAVDEGGKAVVFKATPDGYEKLATNDLGEPVFASPAVADGKLYIRGAKTLFCIGKK